MSKYSVKFPGEVIFIGLIPRVSPPPPPLVGKTMIGALWGEGGKTIKTSTF